MEIIADRDLGEEVTGWRQPPMPENLRFTGNHVSLTPLSLERHAAALYEAFRADREGRLWDYLSYGPFDSLKDFEAWVETYQGKSDPYFFAIERLDQGKVCGVVSFMRISPKDGTIEVGHINFSPQLQRSVAATEAMYLMMQWAFDSGYRRYEWKCNALNRASRRAAQRFGFSYEGIFRQATIVKGHNRDTAWFAAIDKEWPILKQAYQTYLSSENFDEQGVQKVSLSSLTASLLHKKDPLFG